MQLYMQIYCTVCRVQIMTFRLLLYCEGKVKFTLQYTIKAGFSLTATPQPMYPYKSTPLKFCSADM